LRRQALFISLFLCDGLWELVVISSLEEALLVDDQAIILNSNYSIIIYECILFTRYYLMALRIVYAVIGVVHNRRGVGYYYLDSRYVFPLHFIVQYASCLHSSISNAFLIFRVGLFNNFFSVYDSLGFLL